MGYFFEKMNNEKKQREIELRNFHFFIVKNVQKSGPFSSSKMSCTRFIVKNVMYTLHRQKCPGHKFSISGFQNQNENFQNPEFPFSFSKKKPTGFQKKTLLGDFWFRTELNQKKKKTARSRLTLLTLLI